MLLLEFIVFSGVLQIIYGQGYDDLLKDECFKKVYTCGDYRVSVTGGNGQYVAERKKFGEMCRRHKEFIACIDEASNFCSEKLTNFSRMVLNNRISLKLFCRDVEWRKHYFASVPCINKYEQEAIDVCRKEDTESFDGRPWWCLIPEPCDAIKRVFDCSILKMEKHCGSVASEVYRRMHIVKLDNQDVVCEFRRRNPRYCRYQTTEAPLHSTKETFTESEQQDPIRRIGPMWSSFTETVNNIVKAATLDAIGTIVKQIKELDSNLLNSDNFNDRVLNMRYEMKDKGNLVVDNQWISNYAKSYDKDESMQSYSQQVGEEETMYGTEKIHEFSPPQNSDHVLESLIKNRDNSSNIYSDKLEILPFEVQSLEKVAIRLYELLKYRKDIEMKHTTDGSLEIYWKNLNDFNLQNLSCAKPNTSGKEFRCAFKLKLSNEEDDINLNALFTNMLARKEKLLTELKLHPLAYNVYEYSLVDANVLQDREGTSTEVFDDKTERDTLKSLISGQPTTLDDSNQNIENIHRIGYQILPIKDTEYTKATKNVDGEKFLSEGNFEMEMDMFGELKLSTDKIANGEEFVLVEDSHYPMLSNVYFSVKDEDSTISYFKLPETAFEKEPSNIQNEKESLVNVSEMKLCEFVDQGFSDKKKELLQLQEIENALSERFQTIIQKDEVKPEEWHTILNRKLVTNNSNKNYETEIFEKISNNQMYKTLNLNDAADIFTNNADNLIFGFETERNAKRNTNIEEAEDITTNLERSNSQILSGLEKDLNLLENLLRDEL